MAKETSGLNRRNDEAHSWLAVSTVAEHEVGENLVVPAHADMAAAELILEAPIDPLATLFVSGGGSRFDLGQAAARGCCLTASIPSMNFTPTISSGQLVVSVDRRGAKMAVLCRLGRV